MSTAYLVSNPANDELVTANAHTCRKLGRDTYSAFSSAGS
jgi:hypothetical protein